MTEKIKFELFRFFRNGGKRDIYYLSLIFGIILFLMRISATFGDYKRQFDDRGIQVKLNTELIEVIQADLSDIKADVRVIKTYVTGDLK